MTAYDIVQRPERDQLGEAAFWDEGRQALWWVDIAGAEAKRLDPATGEIRRWAMPSFSSAIVPTRRGDAIVALVDGLHRLDLESGLTTPFVRPDPDPGNRSNECRTDPRGNLWLGTMQNNLGPGGAPVPLVRSSGGFFRITPDGASQRMKEGIGVANILCWSPDCRRFYCADSMRGIIWSHAYDPDEGRISDRRVFVEGGPGAPDGSSMDEEGCLWTARWGGSRVIRYTPAGKVDREIALPVEQPSNVAFGGPDRKTLYITSARQELEGLAADSLDGAVFVIPADVAGMPMARFAG